MWPGEPGDGMGFTQPSVRLLSTFLTLHVPECVLLLCTTTTFIFNNKTNKQQCTCISTLLKCAARVAWPTEVRHAWLAALPPAAPPRPRWQPRPRASASSNSSRRVPPSGTATGMSSAIGAARPHGMSFLPSTSQSDSPSLFVIQLIRERWSNPWIPSKNELGNCNIVKNWKIVILPILVLNSQKKSFWICFKDLYFFRGYVKIWPPFERV